MIGSELGPYRIESELGHGGMGSVWGAVVLEQVPGLEPGTRVALKIIHPHLMETPGIFKRFLREAEFGRTVRHENVVRTYDADALMVEGRTQHYLVMEYVEGQTLRELAEELTKVPEVLCRHIGREVAKGLAAVHEAGIVHRDLKPKNILITPEHAIKIMDLGVARLAEEAMRLSRTGAFVGSIRYAAPEQFEEDSDIDGRADLYALGLLLYELSSGEHPHRNADVLQVIRKMMSEDRPRLGLLNPQLSPFFEEVVDSLLRRDRDARFPSAVEVHRVLKEGEESAWWRGRAQSIRTETRRPLRRIRIPRETPIHGRGSELARLEALYDRVREGDGQVVLLEGEAGIGKTRLVDELVGRLHEAGEDVNFLFGSYPPGGAATAAGAWATAYREHFGAEGLTETLRGYVTDAPALIPAFAALLRDDPPPEGKELLTKDSRQTVFVQATRALAKERPTVVLIEDLHFAPEEGRGLFASLALSVPDHAVLLVGTARPGLPEDWRANLERLDQSSRIELTRLGPKDLARLLEDALRSERLATELGHRIALKSDGNPFFVLEIIRGLRESRSIEQSPDGTWSATRLIRDVQIPSSVQDLIQARIAELDETEQELLDVAACCGFEFDGGLVAEVLDVARIPALRRLGHLEKVHRLIRSLGPRYVFDHHQVHESLYGGIAEPLRREYHAAIGDALAVRCPEPDGAQAARLCEHFLVAGRGEDALPHLDATLDYLKNRYFNDRAVALADRALAIEGLLEGRRRAEVLLEKAALLGLLGRREPELATIEEAVALADAQGDPGLHARARLALGWSLTLLARYGEAREELDRARDLAREAGDRLTEGQATGSLGLVYKRMARYGEAEDHLERGLEIAREAGNRRSEGTATGNLGLVFLSTGQFDEARQRFESALAIAREVDDRKSEGVAVGNLGLVFWHLGRFEEARERFERHLAIAREVGDRLGEGLATANLGSVLYMLGRYEAARDHYERKLAITRETGDREGEGMTTGNLGLVALSLGRYAEGQACYERYLAIAREIGARRGEIESLASLGTIRLLLGDLDEARERLEAGLALAREVGTRREEGRILLELSRVGEAEGDAEGAARLAEDALAAQREADHRPGIASALAAFGRLLLGAGRFEEAEARLTEALELGRGLEDPATSVLASVLLALLPGAETDTTIAGLEPHEARLTHAGRMEARFLHWRATGHAPHLEEAHRLLREVRDHVPEEHRETMIANVPLHRDIVAAWEEHGGRVPVKSTPS
jgi:tetratricopeptide (TPR) repeat protein